MVDPKAHVAEDQLADLALGLLAEAELATTERHLSACPECREALESLHDAMSAFSTSGNLGRLGAQLDAAVSGAAGWAHSAGHLAELLGVSPDEAYSVLERAAGDDGWHEQFPGVCAFPLSVPAAAAACLLRVEPGATFPLHDHPLEERVLVLEGGYQSSDTNAEMWRGEFDVRAAGTSHELVALGPNRCIVAVVWGAKPAKAESSAHR